MISKEWSNTYEFCLITHVKYFAYLKCKYSVYSDARKFQKQKQICWFCLLQMHRILSFSTVMCHSWSCLIQWHKIIFMSRLCFKHSIPSLTCQCWGEHVFSIRLASFQKEKTQLLMSTWECSGLQKLFSKICHKWCTFISFNGSQLQAWNISEN